MRYTQEEINDKGKKRLKKLKSIYIDKVENIVHPPWRPGAEEYRRTDYYCFYFEKKMVKYAIIHDTFCMRYGPSVIAILKTPGPTGLWQYKNEAIGAETFNKMYNLFVHGKLDLPVLDLDTLKYSD